MGNSFKFESLRINSILKKKEMAFMQVVIGGEKKIFTGTGFISSVETICDLIQKITGTKFDLISHSLKKDSGKVIFQREGTDIKVSVFSMKDDFKDPLAVFASNLFDGINNVIDLDSEETDCQLN